MASLAIGVVGFFVGALTLGQGLAILTFGIPTARQWIRDGRLTDSRPLKRYKMTLLLLAAILATSTAVVALVFPQRLLAFGLGLAAALVGGVGALRKQEDLLADFMQANASSLRSTAEQKALEQEADRSGFSLREVAALPTSAMEIVGEFSELMSNTPCQVRPESMLPRSRAEIEQALQVALAGMSDPNSQNALRMALSELDTFVPDAEVPEDPDERAYEYLRRRSAGARPQAK